MIGAFNEEFLAALAEGRGAAKEELAHANASALMRGLGSPMYERSQFAHPLLFREADFVELGRASSALLSAQLKIIRHLFATRSQEGVLELFRMPPRLGAFLKREALENGEATVGRMDIVPTRSGYFFCEFNIFPAVGAGEAYTGSNMYFESLGYPRVGLTGCPLRDLAALYTAECRKRELCRVVILESTAHAQLGYPRQELLKRYLEEANPGLCVELLDEVRYPKEWLTRAEGKRILVHRMFTYEEVTDDFAFFEKLWESGAVLMNGFEPELRMSKRFLAMMWESGHQALLSDDEVAAIRQYLPHSFSLTGDNLAFALRHKDELVFKWDAGASYGGSGVLIGGDWPVEVLSRRLRESGVDRWICQQAVEAESVSLRTVHDATVGGYRLVLGLYSYGGKPNGFLVRGSRTSKVVNVSNGGKLGWAFVVSEAGRQALVRHARGQDARA